MLKVRRPESGRRLSAAETGGSRCNASGQNGLDPGTYGVLMHRNMPEPGQRWLRVLQQVDGADRCLVHVEVLPAREAVYREPAVPLPPPLRRALARLGIERLYEHQAVAVDRVRDGRNVVVVTGTASGKTLCYNLPVLEAVLQDHQACALYLYPTKALCQDQFAGLQDLIQPEPRLVSAARAGIYDGDTPVPERKKIRAEANLVFTNPDMLHRAFLPHHARWARLFERLRYVILDELHTYRGIFGANVGCLLRRLRRICQHYGSSPRFIATSATIGNPAELAERLVGLPFELIDRDGSPRGRRFFCFWNPPVVDYARAVRRHANRDAVKLLAALISHGAQAIAFGQSRMGVELLYRELKEALGRVGASLADRVKAYRGGYLPNERREIERALFNGRLKAVVSTNALELGIDVGSLDVAVLVGYPGTIASTWQQAGRAGRTREDSLAVLIARDDPIDQFLVRHPRYFFGNSPEHAVIDPENVYILVRHLACAAYELPLDAESDPKIFGQRTHQLLAALEAEGVCSRVGQRYHFRQQDSPAARISLRQLCDHTVSIVERSSSGERDGEVIATVDEFSADQIVYPQAVYMHDGKTYVVTEYDVQKRIAYVERQDTGYYTQAIVDTQVRILREEKHHLIELVLEAMDGPAAGQVREPDRYRAMVRAAFGLPKPPPQHSINGAATLRAATGDLNVSWTTIFFKKIRFKTYENLGMGPVHLPRREFDTQGLWLTPSPSLLARAGAESGTVAAEALLGLLNLLLRAVPFVSLAEQADIGGTIDAANLGQLTVFLWDRYPGGLGYCERAYSRLDEVLRIALEIVRDCPCASGCPSCVGVSRRLGIYVDPDLAGRNPMPNKLAAHRLLQLLCVSNRRR